MGLPPFKLGADHYIWMLVCVDANFDSVCGAPGTKAATIVIEADE